MNDLLGLAATLEATAATLKELAKVPTVETPPANKYLTVYQAAQYLGVTRATMYGYVKHGLINYAKPADRRVYFAIDDLNAFIERGRKDCAKDLETAAVELLARTEPKKGRKLNALKKGANV